MCKLFVLFSLSVVTLQVSAAECFENLGQPRRPPIDADSTDYARTGDLKDLVTFKARMFEVAKEPLASTYHPDDARTLRAVLKDLDFIDQELQDIPGRPKGECPYEREVARAGYSFKRQDYIGRHVICIRRARDNFYWTIGVHYKGDFWKLGNDVQITGYYHVGTNGNLADLSEALRATQEFFPTRSR